MRVLGVDPGTISCGYGVVDDSSNMKAITYGAIKCKQRSPMGERLLQIFTTLNDVIKEYSPDVVAVESPFVKDNPKTASAIGKAQAVVLLVAAQNGLECFEYPPRLIKQIVSNYGDADKTQMQRVVKILLNLDEIPEPNDAADGLAIAMTHLQQSQIDRFKNYTK